MTVALILANLVVWVMVQGMGSELGMARSLCQLALIPGDLLGLAEAGSVVQVTQSYVCSLDSGMSLVTPLTSMFLHGGWFHIIFNMWFLWVFGDNVEDAMGPLRFLAFYLSCGLVAAATQVATDPASLAPMVGASGAIGGVMGGYIRLYPRARIDTLILPLPIRISLPAMVMLGYWFLLQLLDGIPALQGSGAGVAFWAHIGGFLAGIMLVTRFYRPEYYRQHTAGHVAGRARR
jgi:membrane associated rhomboid family serine protease